MQLKRLESLPCAGIFLALVSGSLFSVSSLSASLLTHINPLEITLVSGILQVLICLPISCIKRESLSGVSGERLHLLNRCLFGLIVSATQFAALHLIPLGDVSTIAYSNPIFTYAFAWILMGEECGVFQFVLVPIVMSGIVLISRPAFLFNNYHPIKSEDRMIGSLLALVAAISQSVIAISIRRLKKTSFIVIMTQMGIVWTFISSLCLVVLAVWSEMGFMAENISMPTSGFDVTMLLLNGLSSIAGQALLILALQIEEAGPISVALSFDIVMSYVLQSIFLPQEEISLMSVGGAFLIGISVGLAAIRKWLNSQKVGKWTGVWCLLNCSCSDTRQDIFETEKECA